MITLPGQTCLRFASNASPDYHGPDERKEQNFVELFGLGTNHRVFGAQYNAAAALQFGWFLTAPGVFNDIVAANANAGVVGGLALATGANLSEHHPFFAAIFNADGTLNQGWI